jgi:hypothetical protein
VSVSVSERQRMRNYEWLNVSCEVRKKPSVSESAK